MKRIPAVLSAVVAMAFVATMALAADSTAPATTAPATTAPAKTTSSSTTHHKSSKSAHAKTDLNTASKEDLMKLPGVDDATADKIIAARPFKSHSELETKNIVTKEQYKKLSAMVTVAPPAKSAAK